MMEASFLRTAYAAPDLNASMLPMSYPAMIPTQIDPTYLDSSKRRKLDGPTIKEEPQVERVREPSNLPAASPVPGLSDMTAFPPMQPYPSGAMYPYAAFGFSPFDPRLFSAAMFMQQQQQQLAAMSRMGYLQSIPTFNPAMMPTPLPIVDTKPMTQPREDLAAARATDRARPADSGRKRGQKRRHGEISTPVANNDEDADIASVLLTNMLSSTGASSPQSSPDKKESPQLQNTVESTDRRKTRRPLSVDVESPTDPASGESPSSPSITSPPSPDSFDEKYEGSSPFSTSQSSTKKGALTCPECGKVFSQGCSLKDHMNIHAGVRPYVCKDCGKSFSNGSNLNRHRRIHTGEKPYVCDICHKSFSQSSNLKVHLKIH